jgi:hypothetical protein
MATRYARRGALRSTSTWSGVVAAAVLTGCFFVDGGGGLGPPGGADGGNAAGGDGGGDGGAKGVDCTITTTNGATLCQGTTECPTATVSQNSWSGCGYKISGKSLDLECECSGFLCPIGTPMPTTCAAANELLITETLSNVCGAAAQGTCVNELFSSDASTSSGNCDMTCAASCATGDVTCMQFCGC